MENTRKKRTFFTKKRMISDLRKMRDDLMENQIATFEISKKYPSIYNYKIFENLVSKDYIKITKKEGKKKFYKWNFRRNLNYHIFDFLYNNAIKSREEIIKRQKKQDAISTSEEPIANFDHPFFHFNEGLFKPRNTAMTLAKEIREKNENWQDAIKRASEILSEKKSEENSKLQIEHREPTLQELFPNSYAQDFKLLNIKYEQLQEELKKEREALTRQQTANKSYKKRIFETEENLNQSLKIIKIQENKIQGYENSLNSEKASAESYKKRFEDAQKSLDEAKKVIKEQEIEIEVLEQKKSFKSIKPKIEPKEVKYFKLFGIKIYEKN